MIKIHLVFLGKLKEPYWHEAEDEYFKRLGPYFKIQIHELREESFNEKDRPEIIKQKEAEKIENTLNKIKDAFIVALDETGQQFSSVNFAQKINEVSKTNSSIVFLFGGPLGLHPSILQTANFKLSLSKMTFTHQMARIFLLEQIYRSAMITANRKYHY